MEPRLKLGLAAFALLLVCSLGIYFLFLNGNEGTETHKGASTPAEEEQLLSYLLNGESAQQAEEPPQAESPEETPEASFLQEEPASGGAPGQTPSAESPPAEMPPEETATPELALSKDACAELGLSPTSCKDDKETITILNLEGQELSLSGLSFAPDPLFPGKTSGTISRKKLILNNLSETELKDVKFTGEGGEIILESVSFASITSQKDISSAAMIKKNNIGIDSAKYPELNSPAHIEFTGVYNLRSAYPLRNGVPCGTYCSNFAYNSKTGKATMDVSGFSNYSVGGINISNAIHLDSSYGFISDITEYVRNEDGNWSEQIPVGDFVRATFEENLSNGKVIDAYVRKGGAENVSFNVYANGTTSPLLGASIPLSDSGDTIYIILENMSGEEDTFDFEILGDPGGYVEFDYIHDTDVGACLIITSSGEYNITTNLVGSITTPAIGDATGGTVTGGCIVISASNVLVDCKGYNITSSVTDRAGILINGTAALPRTNITIQNCPRITAYEKGIYFYYSSNNLVRNTTTISNTVGTNRYGIYLSYTNYTTVDDCTSASNTNEGIRLFYSSNNNFTNNRIYSNPTRNVYIYTSSTNNNFIGNNLTGGSQYGFYVAASTATYNTFADNLISGHTTSPAYGIYITSASNNMTNNTITSNVGYGIYVGGYSYNKIINNTIYGNTGTSGTGIFLTSTSTDYTQVIGNNVSNNGLHGIQVMGSYNNLTDNYIFNNSQYGIYLYTADNANITNNTAKENHYYDLYIYTPTSDTYCTNAIVNLTGSRDVPILYANSKVTWSDTETSELVLCNADDSRLTNINVSGSDYYGNNGVLILRADRVNVTNVNSSNNYDGFYLYTDTYIILNDSICTNNAQYCFYLNVVTRSQLKNNTASFSTYGIYLIGSAASYSVFENNTIYNTSQPGMMVNDATTTYCNFTGNDISNASVSAAFYIAGADSFYVVNNSIHDSQYGIQLTSASNLHNFINNRIFRNTNEGIYVTSTSSTNTFRDNSIYQNGRGIYFAGGSSTSYVNTLINNTIYSNTGNGAEVYRYNGITMTNNTLYNNSQELVITKSSSYTLVFTANNAIITNPYGTLENYTNISIYDTNDEVATSSYQLKWAQNSTALPTGRFSFREKFVNITVASGAPSIDRMTWNWDNGEVNESYNDSMFELWKYNASASWTILNNSPDIAANTLSWYNFHPANSIYGLLQNNVTTNCQVINVSGAYTMMTDYVGAPYDASPAIPNACVVIAASDVSFSCGAFAITNNGTANAAAIVVNSSSGSPYTNITISNCQQVSGYAYGIMVQNASKINISSPIIYNNTYGIYTNSSSEITISSPTVRNNTYGIYQQDSENVTISISTAYANTYGVYLLDSNVTLASTPTFYNNTFDFIANNTGIATMAVNATNAIFRNPTGTLVNYTNISFYDSSSSAGAYYINWSGNSSGTPSIYHYPFAQKYVGISTLSGAVSIDSVVWHWQSTETTGYEPRNFQLWEYDSTWTMINGSPDNSTRTLSRYDLAPAGTYGIFEETPSVLSLILNSTLGTNTTAENLTLYIEYSDDLWVRNITEWYIDDSPLQITNMPFEAGSTATFTKNYGAGSNATVSGATWSATGGYDGWGAYSCDGSNDYIDTNRIPPADAGTINIWFKAPASQTDTWGTIVGQQNTSGLLRTWIGVANAEEKIGWSFDTSTVHWAGGVVNDNKWHMVTLKWGDGSGYAKIYVDAVLTNSTADDGDHTFLYDLYSCGWNSGGSLVADRYFIGYVDELQIYNRSLSDEQILAIYNNQSNLIVSQELAGEDAWKACVTPNDGITDGPANCSNTVEIVPSDQSGCQLIDTSGAFALNIDETGAPITVNEVDGITSACVVIAASNVSLNCADHSITNNGTSDAAGIIINGTSDFSYNNITISNCGNVSGFVSGIHIQNASNVTVSGPMTYGNTYGIYLHTSGNSIISVPKFYNNTFDFLANNSGASAMLLNMSSAIFLNPSGTLENYTNLSIYDSISASSAYSINWTTNSSDLPSIYYYSFAQKYVNISTLSGAVSIDSAVWGWLSSETTGYPEKNFRLWKYNSSGWTMINDTPNTATHTLSQYNMDPSGIYGILGETPVISSIILNSTFGTNTTSENLTVYIDYSSEMWVKNITEWYINDSPLQILNMPFEGGSNSTWTRDYSPTGDNGTVTGPTWNSTGGYDGWGSYYFDGADYITIPANESLNVEDNLTISVWVKPSSLSRMTIYSHGSNTAGGFQLELNGNATAGSCTGGGCFGTIISGIYTSYTGPGLVQLNQWNHIVYTRNGAGRTHILYLNGVPRSLVANNTDSYTNQTVNTLIGARTTATYQFKGYIDDLAIYDRALSPEQVVALYNNRTDLIVSEELAGGDVWKACVTPNDGGTDGPTNCSNNLTIEQPLPDPCSVISSPGNYSLLQNAVGAPNAVSGVFIISKACVVIASSNVDFSCAGYNLTNDGTLDAAGILVNASSTLNYTNVTIRDCPGVSGYEKGIYLFYSSQDRVQNSTVSNGESGIFAYYTTYSNITDSIAYDNSLAGFRLQYADNMLLAGSTAYNNPNGTLLYGIQYGDIRGNLFENNTDAGVSIAGASRYNNLTNDTSSRNSYGFRFDTSTFNRLENSTASYNQHGVYIIAADNTLVNTTVHGSSVRGIYVLASNNTIIRGGALYNNSLDLLVNHSLTGTRTYNMSGMSFRNPYGTLENYTNISIIDEVDNQTSYSLNWTANSSALPANYISFANKFVNLSIRSASPSYIDTIIWSWEESEVVSPYLESKFELWKYNSSGWTLLNNTPNTVSNTLAIYNVNPRSEYGILQNESALLNCTVITSSGTYDMGSNFVGAPNDPGYLSANACVVIAASNVVFNCVGFSITNNGTLDAAGIAINGTGGFPYNNITIENCDVSGYSMGINTQNGSLVNISNSNLWNNTYGVFNANADNTRIYRDMFYNNTIDLLVVNNKTFSITFSMYNSIFSSPSGGDIPTDYTNLSITDTVEASSTYRISWAGPDAPPYKHTSFANKFVEIIKDSGIVGIDTITWNWEESELPGYDELDFELWGYNSGWTQLNTSPNIATNTLSLYNLDPGSDYAILQSLENCTIINESGDYVMTKGYHGAPNNASPTIAKACIVISAENVSFDCNGHTINENDEVSGETYGFFLNSSATNVTIKNCKNITGYFYGIGLLGTPSETLRNVVIDNVSLYNITGGVIFSNDVYMYHAENITLKNSVVAWGFGHKCIYLDDGSDNNFMINNTFFGCGNAYFAYLADNNLFENNTAIDSTDAGFRLGYVQNSIFRNNIANISSNQGFRIENSTNLTFHNNTATGTIGAGTTYSGFYIYDLNSSTFANNTAYNNTICFNFFSFPSDHSNFTGNTVYNCSGQDAVIGSSINSNFTYNWIEGDLTAPDSNCRVLYNNVSNGTILAGSNSLINSNGATNCTIQVGSRGVISNNTLYQGIIALIDESYGNITIANNTIVSGAAYSLGYQGSVYIIGQNITVVNNTIHSSSGVGFDYEGSSATIANNTACNCDGSGFSLAVSSESGSSITNNIACNNTRSGFFFYYYNFTTATIFNNNTAYGNSRAGLELQPEYVTPSPFSFSRIILYNNKYDFLVNRSIGASGAASYEANITILNPAGTYENYTNLSISDSVIAGESYSVNWTENHYALPPAAAISFAQKFLDISIEAGTVSIGKIVWLWNNAELAGYNENDFELWKYNSSDGWTMLNNTPNTTTNTLTLYNLNPASEYGILQNNLTENCPIITTSGEYAQTLNYTGAPNSVSGITGITNACVVILASNVSFDCSGFSITNDGTASAAGIFANTSATNITLKNCPSVSSYAHGITIKNLNGGSFTNMTSRNNSVGFNVNNAQQLSLSNNTAYNNTNGFVLESGSNNNNITLSTAHNNSLYGFYLIASSDYNRLADDLSYNNTYGFFIESSGYNNVTDSFAYNNTEDGFMGNNSYDLNLDPSRFHDNKANGVNLNNCNGVTLIDVSASNNNGHGIKMTQATTVVLDNVNVSDNQGHGLHMVQTDDITIAHSTFCFNHQYGIRLQDGTNTQVSTSDICENTENGAYMVDSSGSTFSDNQVFGNGESGTFVENSDLTYLLREHFYSNGYDLEVNEDDGNPVSFNATNVIFDNPAGNYLYFTNLSINDTFDSYSYTINWTANSSALPANRTSFRQKWINISTQAGAPSINRVIWQWNSGELSGYDESKFELWKYGAGVWTNLNNTPDTSAHTLSLYNLNPASDYGILENELTDANITVYLNSPPDTYVTMDTSITFNCSATTGPEKSLVNLTLYGNWSGSWSANQTNAVTGTSNSTTFTKTFEPGTYTWNCLGFDDVPQSDWGNSNFTFTITNATYNLTGVNVTVINTSKYEANVTAGQYELLGGNLTEANANLDISTEKWAGLYGNFTATSVLSENNSAGFMYLWQRNTSAGGEICLTENQSPTWALLSPTQKAQIDNAWGFAATDSDSANNTLIDGSALLLVAGSTTPTTGVYMGASSNFQMGAFKITGAPTYEKDFAFCVNISTNGTNYQNVPVHFEMIVPTSEQYGPGPLETYYVFAELT